MSTKLRTSILMVHMKEEGDMEESQKVCREGWRAMSIKTYRTFLKKRYEYLGGDHVDLSN